MRRNLIQIINNDIDVVDPTHQQKHENSLKQLDSKGKEYIFNITHRNCFTSLNYFALAVILAHFKIATKVSIELYARTRIYNFGFSKTMHDDDLYQKSINPEIKVEGQVVNIVRFCIIKGLEDQLVYLANKALGINIKESEWTEII